MLLQKSAVFTYKIAAGMRITFAVAGLLILAALAVSLCFQQSLLSRQHTSHC